MKIVPSAYAKPANLRIQAMEDNEPAATLSTNIEGVICRPDCFIAKEYSENVSLCDPFIEDGTFEDTGEEVSSGYVTCRILRYTGSSYLPCDDEPIFTVERAYWSPFA